MGFVNTIGRLFTPQNTMFYDLFESTANTVEEMGNVIKELVHSENYDHRTTLFSKIEDLEHKNDNETHHLLTELGRNFITPFDREDIHALASALDDICDGIYASSKRMHLYNVDLTDKGIRKLTDLIVEGTIEVKKAVYALRNKKDLKTLTESLVKINSIENQADDVYDHCIEELFERETEAKIVIKKREIYQMMEKTTDELEDVANVIESIIIKYS